MQCAILAITLDHKDANTSVVKFFHDLIKGARTQDGNKQVKSFERLLDYYYHSILFLFFTIQCNFTASLIPNLVFVSIEPNF